MGRGGGGDMTVRDETTIYPIQTGYLSVCLPVLNRRDGRKTHFDACIETTR